jgi:hypothetical protein
VRRAAASVTNPLHNRVTVFKAADWRLMGSVALAIQPCGACRDGGNFRVTAMRFGTRLRF